MKKGWKVAIIAIVASLVLVSAIGFYFYHKYSQQISAFDQLKKDAELLFNQGITGPNNCSDFASCLSYCSSNSDACVSFCEENEGNKLCILVIEKYLSGDLNESLVNESSSNGGNSGGGSSSNDGSSQDGSDSNDDASGEESVDCSYIYEDDTICIGDDGVADLLFVADAECAIEYKVNDDVDWTDYDDVTLDENGENTLTDTPGFAGTYTFRMVCVDADGNACTSQDTIVVEDCNPVCIDTDGGNNIWTKGICTDIAGVVHTDACSTGADFTDFVDENWCDGAGNCMGASFSCFAENAMCYQGRCVLNNLDTDGDGFTDLDEYQAGTDPTDAGDNPGTQIDCATECMNLGGYIHYVALSELIPGEPLACSDYGNSWCWDNLQDYLMMSDESENCCCFGCITEQE